MAVLGRRKITRIFLWFLRSIGLYLAEEDTDSSSVPLHFIMSLFPSTLTIITTSIYGFMNLNDFNKVVTTAAFIGANVILNLVIPKLYEKRKQFREILVKIDNNVFTYSDEEESVENAPLLRLDEYYSRAIILIAGYVSLGFSLSLISLIVEFYLSKDITQIRVNPSWYPWYSENLMGTIPILAIQVGSAIMVFWYYYVLQIISFFFTAEYLRQKNRLCKALETLKRRTGRQVSRIIRKNNQELLDVGGERPETGTGGVEIYDAVYYKNVIECCNHYQEILRLYDSFKPWFTFFFTVEIFISTITFAFVFYNLIEVPEPKRMVTLTGSSINVIVNLFSRCTIGEMLSKINGEIMNVIFHDLNWYSQSAANRSLLKMFHLLVKKRSNAIIAFYVFPASFLTFAGITRLSYSYLGLVKATLQK